LPWEKVKVGLRLNRKRIFPVLVAVLLVAGGFAFGFIASLHLKSSASREARRGYLQQAGDAPPEVRAGVITALRAFQDGYIKRDPKNLDAFMNQLFAKNGDVLIQGPNAAEWARGYPAATEFIRKDWQDWGDFRFAADDSVVWSSGDVAWVATVGAVRSRKSDHPLRLSAILTRCGDRWVFRELHFQLDERDASPADILQPATYLRLARLAFGGNHQWPALIRPDLSYTETLSGH
jgi:hypothetical protein